MKTTFLNTQLDRLVNPEKIETLKRCFTFKALSNPFLVWGVLLAIPSLVPLFYANGGLEVTMSMLMLSVPIFIMLSLVALMCGLVEFSQQVLCRLLKVDINLIYAQTLSPEEKIILIHRLQEYRSFFEPSVFQQIIHVVSDKAPCRVWWAELRLVLNQAEEEKERSKEKAIQKNGEALLNKKVAELKTARLEHSHTNSKQVPLILSTEKTTP